MRGDGEVARVVIDQQAVDLSAASRFPIARAS